MKEYVGTLIRVEAEIRRAKTLHGDVPFHSAHEGFAVLDEERDELWDLVKTNWRNGPYAHADANLAHWKKEMQREAIQVAAMAVRFAAELCNSFTATGDMLIDCDPGDEHSEPASASR